MLNNDIKFKIYENESQGLLELPLEHGLNMIICSEDQTNLDRVILNILKTPTNNLDQHIIKYLVCSQRAEFYKNVKFPKFSYQRTISKTRKIIRILNRVARLIDKRYSQFKQENTFHIVEHNKKAQAQNKIKKLMPYIMLVSEFQIADEETTRASIGKLLKYITNKARAAGVIVTILSKKPSSIFMTNEKLYLPNRISFRLSDEKDSLALFYDDRACHLKNDEWAFKQVI